MFLQKCVHVCVWVQIYKHVNTFHVEYYIGSYQKRKKQKKLNCVNHENLSLGNLNPCDNEEGKGQEFKQLTQ